MVGHNALAAVLNGSLLGDFYRLGIDPYLFYCYHHDFYSTWHCYGPSILRLYTWNYITMQMDMNNKHS